MPTVRTVKALPLLLLALLFLSAPVQAQFINGTLAPVPQQVFVDNNNAALAGGFVYTYLAGTSTPAPTYSDSALTTPNANPIVLNSAGRNPAGAIYLDPSLGSYKFIVQTSAAVTIYTQDNVNIIPSVAVDNGIVEGRISTASGIPLQDSDGLLAGTTIYYVPYIGNRISLYDGTNWRLYTFTQLSLSASTDPGATNYDLFAFANSGVVTLERTAWTNDTTRATALVFQDGVYVRSGATTRRYLGTYRKGSCNCIYDNPSYRYVWNYYNRVPRGLAVMESANSWTYTTALYHQANSNTADQIGVVVGVVAETPITIDLRATAANTAAGVAVAVGIGLDSTTTPQGVFTIGYGNLLGALDTPAVNTRIPLTAHFQGLVTPGYHFFAWLEYSTATGTTTWYGNGGAATLMQSGMQGWYMG